MNNRRDIDTVAVVEIGSVERCRLDKEKILSFSHVQAEQTIVIYGDQANPESMIIKSDAVEFQNLLNGVVPLSVLSERTLQYNRDHPRPKIPVLFSTHAQEGLMAKSRMHREFMDEAAAFKAKHQDQDRYWFMPDSQGNFKNISADEIYEVSPNPNSPWAPHV